MKEGISATEKVIRRALKNGVKTVTGGAAKAVLADQVTKVLTYEKDGVNFLLVLQSDVAGRDLNWTTDGRHDEFAGYVESIRSKMKEVGEL
ncbi:MAG: hypothetical protein HY751_00690 [Nitrospinae bacterium]|nr:hypothetical protein [Nitrospinota bacterium]